MQVLSIKGWRKSMGIDQKEMAKSIGVSHCIYLAKEVGLIKWTGNELLDIAQRLSISVKQISI